MAREETSTVCQYLEAVGGESVAPFPAPSHRHRCTARGERQIIAPRTQAAFCLSEQHTNCPFYHDDTWVPPVIPPVEEQETIPDLSELDLSGS
jgi:hypothetical protein